MLPWQRVLTRWLGRQQLRDYRTQLSSVPPAMHELQHLAVLFAALRAASCKPASYWLTSSSAAGFVERNGIKVAVRRCRQAARRVSSACMWSQGRTVNPTPPPPLTGTPPRSVPPCSQRLQLHRSGSMISSLTGAYDTLYHVEGVQQSCSTRHAVQIARQTSRASARPSAMTVMDPSNNKAIQPARSVLLTRC